MRDGEALTKGRVSISRPGSGIMSQTLRVDNTGAFKTDLLEPGLYSVSAYLPGYVADSPQLPTPPAFYRPGDTVTLTMIKGGVITGIVKNSNDEPLVAISVRASRVRDREGKALPFMVTSREGLTDDRGMYRLYGLTAGTYVVSAGGVSRPSGATPPSPYERLVPTYAPSATRDTAVEVAVNYGDEVTVDVQFRGEPGHAISGTIAGATKYEVGSPSWGVSISLFDLRNHADVGNASANSITNFGFALYGVPDGDYEVYASQGSASGDQLASAPKQIKVQGSDVTGITLAVAPLAAIDGRVVFEGDQRAACGMRRESATVETVIYARRHEMERKPTDPQSKDAAQIEVPSVFRNSVRSAIVDAKRTFSVKNVQPGTYRIDPREPAPGWYLKSIVLEPVARNANLARDGVTVRSGERVSGVVVTITEGAAKLSGKILLAEGQSLASSLRVYLVPNERETAENVLRFYQARPEANGDFTVDNIAPGKYWIVARPMEENEYGTAKPIRQDAAFRAKVLHDAEVLKKEITFKPCEQTTDYEVPPSPSPTLP